MITPDDSPSTRITRAGIYSLTGPLHTRTHTRGCLHCAEFSELLLALASTAIFLSESRVTHDHILLSRDFVQASQNQSYFTTDWR
jgi:hypothetical protein